MEKYSVIIPALNEADYTGATLERLQAARARGHEVILVDGGSADDTCARAAPLVDRVAQCAPGRGAQLNLGAQLATGGVYVFLHADTLLPVDFDRVLDAHGVDGNAWGSFDIRLSGAHVMFRIIEKYMNLRSRLTSVVMGDQAIFVGCRLFSELNGYADIPLMEDIELTRRLKQRTPPLRIRQPVLSSSRRWEQHGIVRTGLLGWKLRLCYAMGVAPQSLARQYERKQDGGSGQDGNESG